MNERDVVFLPLGPRHLPHPGVVVSVMDDMMVVVCGGTGTSRDLRRIVVQANSREAKALGLYKETYFYEGNVIYLSKNDLTPTSLRCPPELYWKLRAMADEVIERTGLARLRGGR